MDEKEIIINVFKIGYCIFVQKNPMEYVPLSLFLRKNVNKYVFQGRIDYYILKV